MSGAFQYRPKFRDIRVKPPGKEEARTGEQTCEWAGCVRKGECRAPKSPEDLKRFYWFCAEHAAKYNRSWDFFDGMSEGEIKAFQESGYYGHRPTWDFKNGSRRGDAASRASRDWTTIFSDPHGLFGGAKPGQPQPQPRRLTKLQKKSLEEMGLSEAASATDIRQRYRELVKRLHPDANAGDRSLEDRLQIVIRAYETLKTTGLT